MSGSKKLAPFYDTDKEPLKRAKYLIAWLETAPEEEQRALYEKDFSLIYNCFLSSVQAYDSVKPGKLPKPEDVHRLLRVLELFFRYTPDLIRKKWQFRSISTVLEQLLDPSTLTSYRQSGFDMLLMFIENLDSVDELTLKTLQSALDFHPFVRTHPASLPPRINPPQKLPSAMLQGVASQITELDSVERLTAVLGHATESADGRFAFWLAMFRRILFPVLFPVGCAKAGVPLDGDAEIGFKTGCPEQLLAVVVQHIAKWCSKESRLPVLYEDESNVRLILDIVRQTLAAKKIEPAAVGAALDIFRSWSDGLCRPPQLTPGAGGTNDAGQTNKFIRKMLRQSLPLVQLTGGSSLDEAPMEARSRLLGKLVDVVQNVSKLVGREMLEPKTWLLILRAANALVKTISQKKLQGSDGGGVEQEAAEMFLAVHIRKRELLDDEWREFASTAQTQLGTVHFVQQWKRIMVYLTRELVTLLFGGGRSIAPIPRDVMFDTEYDRKASSMPPELHPLSFRIEIGGWTSETVVVFWQRMLHLLGNPTTIEDSVCYGVVMSAVSALVDMFLEPYWGISAATERPPRNTILSLLGHWLVAGCNLDAKYSSGRCEAFRAFSRIVCAVGRDQEISSPYLAEFYRSVHSALMGNDEAVINAIFIHARDVFLCDIPSSSILVPSMLSAIINFVHAGNTVPPPSLSDSSSTQSPTSSSAQAGAAGGAGSSAAGSSAGAGGAASGSGQPGLERVASFSGPLGNSAASGGAASSSSSNNNSNSANNTAAGSSAGGGGSAAAGGGGGAGGNAASNQFVRSSMSVPVSMTELVRRASVLQLVINMACMPSSLREVPLPSLPGEPQQHGAVYDGLAITCHTMLDRFVREDSIPPLKIRALYGLCLGMADELARPVPRGKLVRNILKTLQDYCQCSFESVAYVCVEQLSNLAPWAQDLSAIAPGLIGDLILSLCKGVATLQSQNRRILVVQHFMCLSRWLSYSPPHVMSEPNVSTVFFETLCSCINASVAPEIREAALLACSYSVAHVAPVLPSVDRSSASHTLDLDENQPQIHLAAGPALILSVRDVSEVEDVDVHLVARDATGIHEWNASIAADRPCRAKLKQRSEAQDSSSSNPKDLSDDAVTGGESPAVGGMANVLDVGDVPYNRAAGEVPSFSEERNTRPHDMLGEMIAYVTASFPPVASPATTDSLKTSAGVERSDVARVVQMQRWMEELQKEVDNNGERAASLPQIEAQPPDCVFAPHPLHRTRVLLAQLLVVSPWGSLGMRRLKSSPDLYRSLAALDRFSARQSHRIGFVVRRDTESFDSAPLRSFLDSMGWTSPRPADAPPSVGPLDRFHSDAMCEVWLAVSDELDDHEAAAEEALTAAKLRHERSAQAPAVQALRKVLNLSSQNIEAQQAEASSTSTRATDTRATTAVTQANPSDPLPSPKRLGEVDQGGGYVGGERWPRHSRVFVVWWACRKRFTPPPTQSGSAAQRIFIVVSPMSNHLFRIEIILEWKPVRPGAPSDTPPFGPLINGMVVSAAVLARLVRQTAINADCFLQRQIDKCDNHPYLTRSVKIRQIIDQFAEDINSSSSSLLQTLLTQ